MTVHARKCCHGEITPRKVTFVQSRVYYVTRDSREHVKEKIGLEPPCWHDVVLRRKAKIKLAQRDKCAQKMTVPRHKCAQR